MVFSAEAYEKAFPRKAPAQAATPAASPIKAPAQGDVLEEADKGAPKEPEIERALDESGDPLDGEGVVDDGA